MQHEVMFGMEMQNEHEAWKCSTDLPQEHAAGNAAWTYAGMCSMDITYCRNVQHGHEVCAVVKAGGIFPLPRIFPSYFMKIKQKIFRENVLGNIS